MHAESLGSRTATSTSFPLVGSRSLGKPFAYVEHVLRSNMVVVFTAPSAPDVEWLRHLRIVARNESESGVDLRLWSLSLAMKPFCTLSVA